MVQHILPCIILKNTKESEHLTQIPKLHLSTSLTRLVVIIAKNINIMNITMIVLFNEDSMLVYMHCGCKMPGKTSTQSRFLMV